MVLPHLSEDHVDPVQTIRQIFSVWLWEAVQRVSSITFENFVYLENLPQTVNRSSCLLEQVREYISHVFIKPNTK